MSDYKLFRKALSTIVETALEKIEERPFNHFINNAISIIKTVEHIDEFAKEAYQARKEGLKDTIREEMFNWYTKEAGYDPYIVRLVIDYATDMVFISIGGTYDMHEKIKEYKNRPKENN